MLPASIVAKAIHLCAVGLGGAAQPEPYAITIRAGAALMRQPDNEPEAEATVRDLLALGADFDAGPLAISGRDFGTFGVTPASVFDACALAHVDDGRKARPIGNSATVSDATALVRRAFGARITDTIRPMSATYGARYSWHKFGHAVDFVPAGGVDSITREQIRAVMGQAGFRLIELLGPGDRGHSNHWHVAFARPGQLIDRVRPVEGSEDWIVTVAAANLTRQPPGPPEVPPAPAETLRLAEKAPPQWDVFAAVEWQQNRGGGS